MHRTVNAVLQILPALRRAFAEVFLGYTDYIYSTERQIFRLAVGLLREFFARAEMIPVPASVLSSD